MKRSFIREENIFLETNPANWGRWGVLGLGPEVGATTLGTILARIASKSNKGTVQYLEIRPGNSFKPLIFEAFGMDRRFLGRPFFDFYEKVRHGENIHQIINRDEGVGWALTTRENVKNRLDLSLVEKLHLIHHISSDILFCDLTFDMKEDGGIQEWDVLLREMTGLLVIVDPLPSKLLLGYPLLAKLRILEDKGKKIYYILNKSNSGVHRRELFDFLKKRPHCEIPYISPECFYECQYNLQLPDRILPLLKEMEKFAKTHEIFL
jgi:hypothetical protein